MRRAKLRNMASDDRYDVHIKTADGGYRYNAFSYGRNGNDLWVQVGDSLEHADMIYFSSSYWCAYCVDPHQDNPLGLDDD